MSWNGATEVRRWSALCGDDRRTFRWRDLETSARLRTDAGWCAVEALDRGGEVLGRSELVKVT